MAKKFLTLITVIAMIPILVSCSSKETNKYYNLTEAVLDDIPLSSVTGSLVINNDNKGVLTLNGESTEIEFNTEMSTTSINELVASYECSDTSYSLFFETIGLVLNFSQTDEENIEQENPEIDARSYEGRFYFSGCDGQWEEYEDRSMALYGTVSDSVICLYNKAYSETIPMVYIVTDNGKCQEGYVMAYKLDEFDAKIEYTAENKDEVNNTEFINSDEYIWNKYNETEDNLADEVIVDVTTITGKVANADGGYNYKIIITEKFES